MHGIVPSRSPASAAATKANVPAGSVPPTEAEAAVTVYPVERPPPVSVSFCLAGGTSSVSNQKKRPATRSDDGPRRGACFGFRRLGIRTGPR